jgi:tetratricopeptide (TPR) repeat protein
MSYLGRSRAYYLLDRMDRSLLDVERALKLDSTLAEAHYQRALYAISANDMPAADYHAGKTIAHSTNERLLAMAHLLRGQARSELNRPAQAIDDLERGLAGGQEDVEAMRILARLYDSTDQHTRSLALLERLCELIPDNVGPWTNRAYELVMLERYEEALPIIEKALMIDKDEPVALSNRAYIRMKLGNEADAWSDVERSLRSYPANAHALRTRAMLRLRKGERSKACEDLTLARALGGAPEVDALIKENCASAPAPGRK